MEKQRKYARECAIAAQLCVVGVALLIPFGAHGCGVQENEHEEARELLERIDRLDPNASLELRAAQLNALEALPIETHALRSMRAVCLAAHRGLLEAERGQASVRAQLDGDKANVDLPALEATLKKATEQHAQAQAARTQCEEQMRKATLHYR